MGISLAELTGKKRKKSSEPEINYTGAGENLSTPSGAEDIEHIDGEDNYEEIILESKEVQNELENEMGTDGGSETNQDNDTVENNPTVQEVVENVLEEKMKIYKVFISGKLLMSMIDTALPKIMATALNTFKKDKKKLVNWKTIRLTKEQMEEIIPAANEVVDYIFQHMNPLMQFMLACSVMYGGNLMGGNGENIQEVS